MAIPDDLERRQASNKARSAKEGLRKVHLTQQGTGTPSTVVIWGFPGGLIEKNLAAARGAGLTSVIRMIPRRDGMANYPASAESHHDREEPGAAKQPKYKESGDWEHAHHHHCKLYKRVT